MTAVPWPVGWGKPSAVLECESKNPYLPDLSLNTAIHSGETRSRAWLTSVERHCSLSVRVMHHSSVPGFPVALRYPIITPDFRTLCIRLNEETLRGTSSIVRRLRLNLLSAISCILIPTYNASPSFKTLSRSGILNVIPSLWLTKNVNATHVHWLCLEKLSYLTSPWQWDACTDKTRGAISPPSAYILSENWATAALVLACSTCK